MDFGTPFLWLLRAGDCEAYFFVVRKNMCRQSWAHFGAQSKTIFCRKMSGNPRHFFDQNLGETFSDRLGGQATNFWSHGVNFCEAKRGFSLDPVGRRLFVSDKKEKALLFEKSNRNSLLVSAEIVKFC